MVVFISSSLATFAQSNNVLPTDLGQSIPVLVLRGTFSSEYQNGTVDFYSSQGATLVSYEAKIKWRGGSTNTEGKHKRNYKIKFKEKQQFFGLKADKNWILDAGQQDLFRLRNRIATELWNDFARKPYYAADGAEVVTGVRGRVVEVFLNDEYVGIYSLTETMDNKTLGLKKSKKGIIHGQLWKTSGRGLSMMYNTPPSFDNTSSTWDVFETKYPDIKDVNPTDYSPLWKAINFVVNSSDEEFKDSVAYYFDLPVVEDYYIYTQTLCAVDNIGKNMYWAIYDSKESPKITFAVWDLDLTVGSSYLKVFDERYTSPNHIIKGYFNLIKRLIATNAGNFNSQVRERYWSARKDVLSTDSLIARYKSYYQLLKKCGAAERETQRWSGDTDILEQKIDYDKEMEHIANWITRHMKVLDRQLFDDPNAINPS
ncbi:CotH kinase family protein [Prevotella jejuni]|uniref:CotH kinase family protein n=1 Tax=Prevotella jejuni TaxID=1177574 RepID=UPI00352EEE2E